MKATSPDGLVVAITGGAQGIGRAIAAELAGSGARVAIGDLDAAAATRAAEALPGETAGFALDVTRTDSFAGFLAAVSDRYGPVDVLVNNAGVMWAGEFAAEPESAAARQLDVNVHGVIRGVKLAAPAMARRGRGQIITVASAASLLPPAGEATYAATKHAVYGYLSAVRAELRGTGVRISVVMPGVVDTVLAAGTATGAVRLLRPAEVASAVAGLIRRPRFEVSIPGRIRALARLVYLLPVGWRDRVLRAVLPDQVAAVGDGSGRDDYQSGVAAPPSGS